VQQQPHGWLAGARDGIVDALVEATANLLGVPSGDASQHCLQLALRHPAWAGADVAPEVDLLAALALQASTLVIDAVGDDLVEACSLGDLLLDDAADDLVQHAFAV